jgi:hypothetical protein
VPANRGAKYASNEAVDPVFYSRVAAGLFAVEAVFPIAHRLAGAEYFGFTHAHNVAVDLGLAVIWLSAALVALLRRPLNGLAALLAGAATSVIHGLLFTIATSHSGPSVVGLPFLGAAVVQFYCTAHAVPAFTEEHARREAAAETHKLLLRRLVPRRAG